MLFTLILDLYWPYLLKTRRYGQQLPTLYSRVMPTGTGWINTHGQITRLGLKTNTLWRHIMDK